MTVIPFDYLGSRNDADELIEEFGQTAYLRRNATSGVAWEPTQTPTDYATFAVKVDFTFKQLQTEDVLVTDERWLVAAGPLDALGIATIATPDALVVGGVVKSILLSTPINPAGVNVVYDCHIRY